MVKSILCSFCHTGKWHFSGRESVRLEGASFHMRSTSLERTGIFSRGTTHHRIISEEKTKSLLSSSSKSGLARARSLQAGSKAEGESSVVRTLNTRVVKEAVAQRPPSSSYYIFKDPEGQVVSVRN